VSEADAGKRATDIFDDMDALRAAGIDAPEAKAPVTLKDRKLIEFVMVPYAKAWDCCKKGVFDATTAIVLELDRLIFEQHKNPVLFWSPRLKEIGIKNRVRHDALHRLEADGVIKIIPRGTGRPPLVTYLWRRLQD
jgi:hypothetical protein